MLLSCRSCRFFSIASLVVTVTPTYRCTGGGMQHWKGSVRLAHPHGQFVLHHGVKAREQERGMEKQREGERSREEEREKRRTGGREKREKREKRKKRLGSKEGMRDQKGKKKSENKLKERETQGRERTSSGRARKTDERTRNRTENFKTRKGKTTRERKRRQQRMIMFEKTCKHVEEKMTIETKKTTCEDRRRRARSKFEPLYVFLFETSGKYE